MTAPRRTRVMGVLNVTPDSFSDGGRYLDQAAAVAQGQALAEAGADVIDVGGESTRPGSDPVSVDEELRRVMPVLEALAERGMTLSIDTTKAAVARAGLAAGVRYVNDVSGLAFDPALAAAVAEHPEALLILGHTRGSPKTMQRGAIAYPRGVVTEVAEALERAVERAVIAGVARDRVWVDPGFGFGKTLEHNLDLMRGLRRFGSIAPVVVGTSRKRFLGALTGRDVHERGHATSATTALAAAQGVAMVRVHEVGAAVDVIRVVEAVLDRPAPGDPIA